LVGGWQYLAFVADQIHLVVPAGCFPGTLSDGTITYLKPPPGLGLDLPRWTQEGRLLVIAHSGEPIQGIVYVYDPTGQGQAATGSFVLSSSHDGQKWFPWQPGKTWQVDPARLVDSYYGDE
jgi:hypothetical protein